MTRFTQIGNRFKVPYRTDRGTRFFGQVLVVPQQVNPAVDYRSPRRIVKVSPDCKTVRIGDTFRTPLGRRYLVADNADSDYLEGAFKTYKLFEADTSFHWIRRQFIEDPVTRLPREVQSRDFGTIWGLQEPYRQERDQMRISERIYRVAVGVPIEVDDLLNDLTVREVDQETGIYIGLVSR